MSIERWQGHEEFHAVLVATGRFEQRARTAHRLDYHAPDTGETTWLDIVPFGALQDGSDEIAWPPDQSVRMNVAGFAEALDAAVRVEITTGLVVPVASIPAQAMLKIIAWRDRHTQDRKDATDLRLLLATYAAAGNMDRLYVEASDLLDRYGYDPDLAGAALLGRDMTEVVTSGCASRF